MKASGNTPDLLRQAALTCIADRGLAATTSRDIANAAGVNLAAITYHFGSKDALVAESLLVALRRWLEPAQAALATDCGPGERAAAVVAALQTALDDARAWVPAYLESLVAARHHPGLAAGLHELRQELGEALARQVVDLRDVGVLGPWVDPEAMARLLVAMADGLAVQVVLDVDTDVAPVFTQALSLLLAAGPPAGKGTSEGPEASKG